MRAVVTGGAGFIGSNACEALLELGYEVLVIDNLSTGKLANVPANAELAEVHIASAECERLIADYAPRLLLHFAAQIDVRKSVADPAFDARTNVEGTLRVAGAAARAGVEEMIFASSGGAIYGEQVTFPAAEDHPTRAESPYGIAKRCGELYLDYFSRTSRMRTVALRFANVYGPRQDPLGEAGVVAIFTGKMLRHEEPLINGDGEQTRDYVYVGDVVRACLAALKHKTARGEINIGTGIETSVSELARLLAAATGYTGPIRHGPAKPGEQKRSVLAIGRARELLHWQPQTPLARGLEETVDYFRHAAQAPAG